MLSYIWFTGFLLFTLVEFAVAFGLGWYYCRVVSLAKFNKTYGELQHTLARAEYFADLFKRHLGGDTHGTATTDSKDDSHAGVETK